MNPLTAKPPGSAVVFLNEDGRFLPQCLESLFAQTLPFREIILLGNLPADSFPSAVRERLRKNVFYVQTDLKPRMKAWDSGVRNSTGEWIAFLGEESSLSPSYHEKMIRPFAADEKTGLVLCSANDAGNEGRSCWYPVGNARGGVFDFYRFWKKDFSPEAVLFRRKAWRGGRGDYGALLPDGKREAEEWDHALAVLREGWSAHRIPERLFTRGPRHEKPSSDSGKDGISREDILWKIREKHLPSDLTVIVIFPVFNREVEKTIEDLKAMEFSGSTQVIFLNGSPRSLSDDRMKTVCDLLVKCPFDEGLRLDRWKARALALAQPQAMGKNILLVEGGVRLSGKSGLSFPGTKKEAVIREGVFCGAAAGKGQRFFSPGARSLFLSARIFHEISFKKPWDEGASQSLEDRIAEWARRRELPGFTESGIFGSFGSENRSVSSSGQGESGPKNAEAASRELPGVSIVIPAFNAGKTLGALLESLRNLDYPADRCEILLVDNGSTDDTKSAAARFPGMKYLFEPKTGSYAARNRGILESRHEFIAFLDADGVVTSDWLKELLRGFSENDSAGMVAGPNFPLGKGSRVSKLDRKFGGLANQRTFPAYGITMNVIYRRQVFDEVGLFDEGEKSGSDVDLSWRMQKLSAWRPVFLPDRGFIIHQDETRFLPACRRYLRIGAGHYNLYLKHPELLSHQYEWLPEAYWELALRFFKRAFLGGDISSVWGAPVLALPDRIFLSFRSLLYEWGYLARKKQGHGRPERKALAGEPSCILLFGKEPLRPGTPVHEMLCEASCEGIAVIHLDPARSFAFSFYEAFLSLCGGTVAWQWHLCLTSLARWRFLPEFHPLIKAMNDRITAGRILQLLKRNPARRILIAEEFPGNSLEVWKQRIESEHWKIETAGFTENGEAGLEEKIRSFAGLNARERGAGTVSARPGTLSNRRNNPGSLSGGFREAISSSRSS